MSKNIVVLSDGTGQDGGQGHDSNVYKLYRMLEDRTQRQIVFYDQGLGTDRSKVSGNAFGVGFSKNISDCYRFIFNHYEVGDKIFLFGFSRGAATVRSLASFIHFFGILPRARAGLIDQAYELYRTGRKPAPQENVENLESKKETSTSTLEKIYSAFSDDLTDKARQFIIAHPNMWAEVEFLGVWDTVPALGVVPLRGLNLMLDRLPWSRHSFHDFALHKSVRNAYQALAIDDDREWFLPTIWNQYGDESRQHIEQVWFSGSHTDVGGGYSQAGLSDLTLEWMIHHALNHGIHLYLGSRRYWNFCVAPDATDALHPPRMGAGRIFKAGSRDQIWDTVAQKNFGPPVLHESVLERAQKDPTYRPWILRNYQNYPDPQTWLEESLERHLRLIYEEDLHIRFQEWCVRKWKTGTQILPSFEEWQVLHRFSFAHWRRQNRAAEKIWLEKHQNEIVEFEGVKYVVDRTKQPLLRDYDQRSFSEKLHDSELDRHANDRLVDRAMLDGRLAHDKSRWG